MAHLTITLDDNLHQALKETAARQNRSIGSIIEESLELRGIPSYDSAKDITSRGRSKPKLGADQAIELAGTETKKARRRK